MRLVLLFFLCAAPAFAQATLFGTPQSNQDLVGGDSTFNVNIPNGGVTVTASTIVFLACAQHAGTPTFSTPAGFTLLQSELTPGAIDAIYTFFEIFSNGATLPANVACAASGGGWTHAGGLTVAYQGFDPAAAIDVSGVANSSTPGATVVGPAVTTSNNNDVVGWFFYTLGDIGTGAISVSQGTKQIDVSRANYGANAYLAYADNVIASAGTSGTNTLSYSNSTTQKAMVTFGLSPAAVLSQGAGFGGKAMLGGKAVAN